MVIVLLTFFNMYALVLKLYCYSLAYKYLDSFFSFQDGLETPYKGISFLSFKKPAWNLAGKIFMLSAWGKRRRKKRKGGERRREEEGVEKDTGREGKTNKGKEKRRKEKCSAPTCRFFLAIFLWYILWGLQRWIKHNSCFLIICLMPGSMDMNLNKLWKIVEDRDWHAAVQQSQTRLSDCTTATSFVTQEIQFLLKSYSLKLKEKIQNDMVARDQS